MANYVTTLLTGPVGMLDVLSRRLTVAEMLMHEKIQYLLKRRAVNTGTLDAFIHEPTPRATIDFNQIVPEPKHVVPAGSQLNVALIQNAWRMRHWGSGNTAQNLRTTDLGSNPKTERFSFETPYLHPKPLMTALSRRLPERSIAVFYAEEDLCDNIGQYVITNGVAEPTTTPQRALKEFAAHLIHGMSVAELSSENHGNLTEQDKHP